MMRTTGSRMKNIGAIALEARKYSIAFVTGRIKTSRINEIAIPNTKSATECIPRQTRLKEMSDTQRIINVMPSETLRPQLKKSLIIDDYVRKDMQTTDQDQNRESLQQLTMIPWHESKAGKIHCSILTAFEQLAPLVSPLQRSPLKPVPHTC